MPLFSGDSSRYHTSSGYAYSPSSYGGSGAARFAQDSANARAGTSGRTSSNYADLARNEYNHHESVGQHRNQAYSQRFGGGFAPEGGYASRYDGRRANDRLAQDAARYGGPSSFAFSPDSIGRSSSRYGSREESYSRGGAYDRYFGGRESGFAPLNSYAGSGSRARDGQGYYSNYTELANREYGHHDAVGRASGDVYDQYFGGRDSGFAPQGSYSTGRSGQGDRLAEDSARRLSLLDDKGFG